MKKILFVVLLLWGVAEAQPVPGYTWFNSRNRFFAAAANDFLVPAGTSPVRGLGSWDRSGALFYDSTGADSGLYVYHRPYWVKVGASTLSTLQNIFDNEGRKALLTQRDTIKFTSGFTYTQVGQDSSIANLTIDLSSPGASNDPGKVNLRSRNFGGIGFKYEGSDPGFVRMAVDNAMTPTIAAGLGIPYANSIAGYSARCTNFTGVLQLGINVGGGYFGDSSAIILAQNIRSLKVATNANQPIRFSGSVLEANPDWGQWNAAGHFLINTTTDVGGKYLVVPNSVYFGDSVFTPNIARVADTTGFDIDVIDRATGNHQKIYAGLVGGGGGSTNTSIGAGFKVAVDATNNIKSLSAKYGIVLDSATAGEVGIAYDSTTANPHIRASITPSWALTGNSIAGGNFLGTTSNNALRMYTNNTYRGMWDSAGSRLLIGEPTYDANTALNVRGTTNSVFDGGRFWSLNLAGSSKVGWGGISWTGGGVLSPGTTTGLSITNRTYIGTGVGAPTARLEIEAGSATANTAPIELNSGTIETTPRAGLIEYDGNLRITKVNAVRMAVGANLESLFTSVGNVGTGEDDLQTFTVPAGTLSTDGDYLEFVMAFSVAANSTLKAYFGATQLFSFAALAADAVYRVTGQVVRTGAATQRVTIQLNGGATATVVGYQTPAETLSGTVILKATGEGASNDDIVQTLMTVKYFPNN